MKKVIDSKKISEKEFLILFGALIGASLAVSKSGTAVLLGFILTTEIFNKLCEDIVNDNLFGIKECKER